MKLSRWNNPKVSLETLALKLCEEVGEVAKEITEGLISAKGINERKLIEELDHVIDIAKILKGRC